MPAVAQQIDWSGIRQLALTVGVREAARRAGANLPPHEQARFVERVLKRSSRQGWVIQKNAALAIPSTEQAKPLSAKVLNGTDSLLATLAERKNQSRLHLSKYVVDASKEAAKSNGTLGIAPLVDKVANVHAKVWPEEKQSEERFSLNILSLGQVQINTGK